MELRHFRARSSRAPRLSAEHDFRQLALSEFTADQISRRAGYDEDSILLPVDGPAENEAGIYMRQLRAMMSKPTIPRPKFNAAKYIADDVRSAYLARCEIGKLKPVRMSADFSVDKLAPVATQAAQQATADGAEALANGADDAAEIATDAADDAIEATDSLEAMAIGANGAAADANMAADDV